MGAIPRGLAYARWDILQIYGERDRIANINCPLFKGNILLLEVILEDFSS